MQPVRDQQFIHLNGVVEGMIVNIMGSPDSSSIGVPQAQEGLALHPRASCGFTAPIDELSGLPILHYPLWYSRQLILPGHVFGPL